MSGLHAGADRDAFAFASSEESSKAFALEFEPDDDSAPASKSENYGQFRQILTDEESRTLMMEHKKYLKRLVEQGHKDLQSFGFFRMNQSSLRSIITEKLSRSTRTLQKVEADFTDATEDTTEFSDHHFDHSTNLVFDFDEQQQAMDRSSLRSLRREEAASNYDGDDNDSFALPMLQSNDGYEPVPASSQMIRLSPDLSVSLRGAMETWQAIKHACTVATTCRECNVSLHVVEDAEYVLCLDCWMAAPVEHLVGGIALELDGLSDNYGIGLGVKAEEVLQWVEEEAHKTQIV